MRKPPRGEKAGEPNDKAFEDFGVKHGLTNEIRLIWAIRSLPNGAPNSQKVRVRRAYILDLFANHKPGSLLTEFYEQHLPTSEKEDRQKWRNKFNKQRTDYERSLFELPPMWLESYNEIRRKLGYDKLTVVPSGDDDNIGSPKRIESVISRIDRDIDSVDTLKRKYEYQCQICRITLPYADAKNCIQVHHLWPLGEPHNGPDTTSNMMVLCPNHHAVFDRGVPRFVDNQTVEIYGVKYDLSLKHEIAKESIEYYIKTIFKTAS